MMISIRCEIIFKKGLKHQELTSIALSYNPCILFYFWIAIHVYTYIDNVSNDEINLLTASLETFTSSENKRNKVFHLILSLL